MNFLKRFARNRGAVIGILILLAVIAFAILAPTLYPQSPWRPVARPFLAPFVNERFPLGTDTLGRNLAAGLVHGARVSLMIGVVSTLVALVIGVPLGAMAGYAGGFVDDALMRFTEFFQTIPSFALAIVLVAILQPQLGSIVLAIGVVSWPPVARLVRGGALATKSRICPGGGDHRPVDAADHLQPGPAQHHRADHRHGLADDRLGNPA